jgi:hypothetical protein
MVVMSLGQSTLTVQNDHSKLSTNIYVNFIIFTATKNGIFIFLKGSFCLFMHDCVYPSENQ